MIKIGKIYKICNDINNKLYIGKTSRTLEQRFYEHKRDADNDKYNSKLHRAMNKYGIEHFKIELIEECADEFLSSREKYYIDLFNSVLEGYNISYGGEGESSVDIKWIISLFDDGFSIKQIHEITSYSCKTISNYLKSNNRQTKRSKIGSQKFSEKELHILWNEGYTVKEISEKLKCDKRTCSDWLRKYNIATSEDIEKRRFEKMQQTHSKVAIIFNNIEFPSLTDTAKFLQKEYPEKFKNVKIKTIIQGISHSKNNKCPYKGLYFYQS